MNNSGGYCHLYFMDKAESHMKERYLTTVNWAAVLISWVKILSLYGGLAMVGSNTAIASSIMLPVAPPITTLTTTSDTQSQKPQSDDTIVRIDTSLVQIDVVVTDKKGRFITDLQPTDFELREDTRLQPITSFNYVDLSKDSSKNKSVQANINNNNKLNSEQPSILRPEQVQRTFALVVDDLGLPFESVKLLKSELAKFVEKQLLPGDLVALVRTSRVVGALQRFTNSRNELLTAIDQISYTAGLAEINNIAPITRKDVGVDALAQQATAQQQAVRQQFLAIGALNTLQAVVKNLQQLPGRKALLFFSAGIPLGVDGKLGNTSRLTPLQDRLQQIGDLANRAAVVFYPIDIRGLQPLGLTAEDQLTRNIDSLRGSTQQPSLADLALTEQGKRADSYRSSQAGLQLLAILTGGKFTIGADVGIKTVLADQEGYYLLGYEPEEQTFVTNGGQVPYHRLSVRVKRSGLQVRTRTGFYGVATTARSITGTPADRLLDAIVSPFNATDMQIRLTPVFSYDEKEGKSLNSLLHIASRDLTFVPQPDGQYQVEFEILAATLGEGGVVVEQLGRTNKVRLSADSYQKVRREGLALLLTFPVKKSGNYQLRVAIRDVVADRLGSAGQVVQIPEMKKRQLAVSGLILDYNAAPTATITSIAPVTNTESVTNTEPVANTEFLAAAVRKFRKNSRLTYLYHIYNPRLKAGQPSLSVQVKLYREGEVVYRSEPEKIDITGQKDFNKIAMQGDLKLSSGLMSGKYILQVIVIDKLATNQLAQQDIDFEILP
jgi:VWFA-related protein